MIVIAGHGPPVMPVVWISVAAAAARPDMPERGFELTFEVDVARPPDEVFALLTDPNHFRDVDPAMLDHGPAGPLIAGSQGWFKHRRGGLTARTTYRVTDLDAPRRREVAISGMGYGMTETAELEATPTGTHARFVDRVSTLPGRLLVALSSGIMRRDLRARAARLKSRLEGEP